MSENRRKLILTSEGLVTLLRDHVKGCQACRIDLPCMVIFMAQMALETNWPRGLSAQLVGAAHDRHGATSHERDRQVSNQRDVSWPASSMAGCSIVV